MIKAIFTALTGITEDIDSEDYQQSWERRCYLDENDLDDDEDLDNDDLQDEDDQPRKGWLRLW